MQHLSPQASGSSAGTAPAVQIPLTNVLFSGSSPLCSPIANAKPSAVASANNNNNNSVANLVGFSEKSKKWQMEMLMERLRTKTAQHPRTFPELSKSMRMSMLEKRYGLDAVEKSNLQKCLDSMQHCIRITTRPGLVERLEALSRQLGLKFMEDTNGLLFISSDMFYLEIVLDAAGTVQDVKVHHECKIEQQSCAELIASLRNGDFADFTTQLEGLSSIYQLNAESKIKSKAFVALQAMETDLQQMFAAAEAQSANGGGGGSSDVARLLAQSAVGIVQPRRGGHPMRLTYFVPAYELLSADTRRLQPLSVQMLLAQQHSAKALLGLSVTVNLEAASPANKLQLVPTVHLQENGSVTVMQRSATAAEHSIMLPATFVLRLNRPMALASTVQRHIQQKIEHAFGAVAADAAVASAAPMLGLIARQTMVTATATAASVQAAADSGMRSGMFVSLPDQNHCYFMTENRKLCGTLVQSIAFTEPSHVEVILGALRQQALFNTLIGSCIRPSGGYQCGEYSLQIHIYIWESCSESVECPIQISKTPPCSS